MLNIPLKDYLRETRLYNARLAVAAGIALALLLLLVVRLAYLQVINYRHYATLSQANRVKPIPIQPVRGLILDRNGMVLAQNYPVYTLEVIPEQVDDLNELLADVSELVRITDTDLKSFRKQLRERPKFENLTLRTHLTEQEAARIAVRRPFLTGVELEGRLQRHYPQTGLGVHALGYVSRISESDLERIDKTAYRGMRHIGKLGVEAQYESVLLGRVGFEKIETNAHGRALRALERVAPVAGENLYLNIDARVQAVAEQALGKRRGAVVAIEPATGGVIAFASTPTYDANAFVNGIDTASYRALLEHPDKPLINRALNGQYAPGSTVKAFLGLAALEAGPAFNGHAAIACPGYYSLPGSRHLFRDWKKGGHGMVDLNTAIVQSCDVYFYRLAVAIGPSVFKTFLGPFGFGKPTGIDIAPESSGILPSPEWKAARGQRWYPADTVIAGIGQGAVLATPLQLAAAIATIANRGVRMKPTLMRARQDPRTKQSQDVTPMVTGQVTMQNREHMDMLIKHLTDVVHTNRGTAYGIGYNAPYRIAGKTGTAQVRGIAQGQSYNEKTTPERFRDHALFVAFAPVDAPQVAVAVIVENGGHGSSAAAPIARKVMDQVVLGKSTPIAAPKPTEEDE